MGGAWSAQTLLSGSTRSIQVTDIQVTVATALSLFCSHYSTTHRGELLRQKLPEQTDEDIEWLLVCQCGLTEATEAWEPVSANADPGAVGVPAGL